jgi:hypothetical protein
MMVEFSPNSMRKIAQSVGDYSDYDEKVDIIYEIFKNTYNQGDMVKALSSIVNNLEEIVDDSVNRLDSDINTPWLNAILNFVEDLEGNGMDVSQVDVDNLAARAKTNYMNQLKSDLRVFFEEWRSQDAEDDAADEVLTEVTSIIAEGYKP